MDHRYDDLTALLVFLAIGVFFVPMLVILDVVTHYRRLSRSVRPEIGPIPLPVGPPNLKHIRVRLGLYPGTNDDLLKGVGESGATPDELAMIRLHLLRGGQIADCVELVP